MNRVVFFYIVFVMSAIACDRPLRIHIDLDAPSSYWNEKQQLTGMDIEITEALAKQAQCKIEWHTEVMSGVRILRSVEAGDIDGIVRASKTKERDRYAWFTQPYRDEVVGLYALRSTQLIAYSTLRDAYQKGLRLIGPVSGYYGDEFESVRRDWERSGRYTEYKNAVTAVQLLFAKPKRGEIVLIDADVLFYHADAAKIDEIYNPSQWLRITDAHLMFSKKTVSEANVERLNAAIKQLQQSGRLQQIVRHYRPAVLAREVALARKRQTQ